MVPQEELRLNINREGNFNDAHQSVMDDLMMGDSMKNARLE